MIVEVVGGQQEHPQVRVVDVEDLARVRLALGEVTDEEADGALREAGLGRLDDDGGHLDVAALRAAGERSGGAGWAERFDQLVGSTGPDGGVLHVAPESAAGA